MTEQILFQALLKQTRQQTWFYFHKIPEDQLHARPLLQGKELNSAFWIMAHLAVSGNFLLLHATGGDRLKLPWARAFGLGSTVPAPQDCPPFSEVKTALDESFQRALSHLNSMEPNDLDLPTSTGTTFGGEDSRRSILGHALRHEASHAGHLAWLAKAFGAELV